MQETVSIIPDLIAQLRDADPTFKVFGSKKHQYRLESPQTERNLATFESVNGCMLPTDYREYLLTVADGGAGPYYGIESLKTACDDRTLSKPFPFTTETNTFANAELNKHSDCYEDSGTLELCHHGCCLYAHLVVCGPTYGTMWDVVEDYHFYPLDISFASWYCRWANQKIARLANEPLVTQLKCGMATTDVDGIGGNWKRRETTSNTFYESPDIPAQLEIDGNGIVRKINPWSFI
ncbi:MAG: hypothetical protein WBB29_05505 [Geitlerinemataceae cyanobacterium]